MAKKFIPSGQHSLQASPPIGHLRPRFTAPCLAKITLEYGLGSLILKAWNPAPAQIKNGRIYRPPRNRRDPAGLAPAESRNRLQPAPHGPRAPAWHRAGS